MLFSQSLHEARPPFAWRVARSHHDDHENGLIEGVPRRGGGDGVHRRERGAVAPRTVGLFATGFLLGAVAIGSMGIAIAPHDPPAVRPIELRSPDDRDHAGNGDGADRRRDRSERRRDRAQRRRTPDRSSPTVPVPQARQQSPAQPAPPTAAPRTRTPAPRERPTPSPRPQPQPTPTAPAAPTPAPPPAPPADDDDDDGGDDDGTDDDADDDAGEPGELDDDAD